MYELLATIDRPDALRKLDRRDLQTVAEELRAYVLESVSRTGGHLSSNLGTVELSIALHYVYDTPHDRIIWDVGHQTYPHKILTGRREAMARLRMWEGISGFPRRAESEFDSFGTAHSSTSISAALGMAEAARIKGEARHVVAVIGDGAMSGGMAFEAMNNAGVSETDLLVILNDNEMSISPAVGALNRYLARLMTGPYVAARSAGKRILGAAPGLAGLARRAEEHFKGMLVPSTLFEEFGFQYFGPIDGHDLDSLIPTLRNIKNQGGPRLLHVITKKGQGYKLAEADPVAYHGVSKFQPEAGLAAARGAGKLSYTQVFGDWLCDMAARDPRLVGITPAMREGSGLVRFQQEYPGRYFDVGIAEQHAVTFAAGLACDGMKPVLAIYSTFLQRGYDQLIHDVCIQNLPVLFALDRAGFVGADGATHHGAFDVSYLRCLPNLTIMAPADENECRQMLYTGFTLDGPSAVRYPRGGGSGVSVQKEMTALPVGKAQVRRSGGTVVILSFGSMLGVALAAGDMLDATVVNMRFVKPMDESMVLELAARHDLVVTLEEAMVAGGAGSGVSEVLAANRMLVEVLHLGMPDKFVEHGDQQQLLASVGLDTDSVVRAIRLRLAGRRAAARA